MDDIEQVVLVFFILNCEHITLKVSLGIHVAGITDSLLKLILSC